MDDVADARPLSLADALERLLSHSDHLGDGNVRVRDVAVRGDAWRLKWLYNREVWFWGFGSGSFPGSRWLRWLGILTARALARVGRSRSIKR